MKGTAAADALSGAGVHAEPAQPEHQGQREREEPLVETLLGPFPETGQGVMLENAIDHLVERSMAAKKPISRPGTMTEPAIMSAAAFSIANTEVFRRREDVQGEQAGGAHAHGTHHQHRLHRDREACPQRHAEEESASAGQRARHGQPHRTSQSVVQRSSVRNSVVTRKNVGTHPDASAIQTAQRWT